MASPVLLFNHLPDLLPMVDRSPGLHVSEIITSLCVRYGYFEEGGKDRLSTTWAQLGCALEDTIARRFEEEEPGRYVRPGELELDGIYGTPDLYDIEEERVVEIKLSWMSSNQDVEGPKFWRYWTQLMAYCRMGEWRRGLLVVVHVNGNWGQGGEWSGPVANGWGKEWGRRELAENWMLLRGHGEEIEREMEQEQGQADDEGERRAG